MIPRLQAVHRLVGAIGLAAEDAERWFATMNALLSASSLCEQVGRSHSPTKGEHLRSQGVAASLVRG